MAKTIGVVSLKGGVGKTSVVCALGYAFSNLGKKVLLIDGNLSAPNLGMHLDLFDPEKTLHSILRRKANPSDAVYSLEDFDVLPADIFDEAKVQPLMLKKRINHLKRSYDVILIDSSPRLDDETLAVMLASDELIVVTTPDLPTLGTTMKAVKLARKRGTNISGLVLNKVHKKNFEVSLEDIEETLDLPVLAVIPHDVSVLKALSEFQPSTKQNPKSKATDEYKRLAATLVGEKYNESRMKKLTGWINPGKQEVNRIIFYENLFE
jgi:septum site-determining protein MinD